MAADIVIRGGTVLDGTGAPGRVADVAIEGDVISEIGSGLSGKRELDASGCVVSPGFIDVHTHYDAQVFWDPALRPSSYQGVTTVVAGNCGFTIAPTRPEHHEVIARTLENVEDMNHASLVAGIPWDFETFPEYLESVQRRGTVINFTSYIGHTSVRLYAMGDDAYEREATPAEIERMCELVTEGIASGAAGYSTSFAFTHRGLDGKPVPSRYAGSEEVAALFDAAGKTGRGAVLSTPGPQCSYPDFYEVQKRIGRPFIYPLFAGTEGGHYTQLRMHEDALKTGTGVWPQVTPRPLIMEFNLAEPFSFNVSDVFAELMPVDRATRIAAYKDPEWRARAAADLEKIPMKPRWGTCEVFESAKFPELEGRIVADLARERGCGPLDLMCELAVEEDLKTRFRIYVANDDVDDVTYLLNLEQGVLGLSDAGAHVGQICDAVLYTDLLVWVREREVMPLEKAVRKMTGEGADIFGFDRRGYLREGYWADVCVFDPQTVSPGPIRRVRDFPANAERLTAEEPTGVRHVLVNGTPIRVDEVQRPDVLDVRPGRHASIL